MYPAGVKMNKSELVNEVKKALPITTGLKVNKQDIEAFINAFVDVVQAEVSKGGRVSLVGFGSFESKRREERAGRNPKTGEKINIPAANVPVFVPGKVFKEQVAQREMPFTIKTSGRRKAKAS